MKKNSRTKNSFINSTVGFLSKILVFIVQFICRTVFIKQLSTDYLGINGLFSNILTVLSLAELGVGSAIIFKLYKPIHDEDKEKIKTYLNFYRKAYTIIGLVIFMIGIMIVPFLNVMIKEVPDIKENIKLIYILFLLNTSISYFFTYKKSIISGYQKEYVITLIDLIVLIIQNTLQIIFLYLTKNYIVYIIIQILGTILINIISSYFANKMFPFIKEKNIVPLTKKEEKNIFEDVKALVFYNAGYVVSNGTDNIIISSFIGVAKVGLLSNYTTLTTAVTQFLASFFKGFTASIGGLNAEDDNSKKESIYYQIILLCFFIYGIVSIEFTVLVNPFIKIWLGNKYLLDFWIAFILGLNLYIDGMRYSNSAFRSTTGLFKQGKFKPLVSSIVNIILSIILVKPLGIFGVLLATALARVFITTSWDPYLLHKYKFKTSSKKFYLKYVYYMICYFAVLFICNQILALIKINGILGIILDAVIVFIVTSILFILLIFWTKEYKELYKRCIKIINSKRNLLKIKKTNLT